jgi:hypothetical protein
MSDDNQSGESPDNKPSDGGLDHDGTVFVHRCGDEDCPDFMKPLKDGICPSQFDLIDRIGDLEARLDRIEFPARYD